ncbi:hypothetical protein CAOG_01308 [Capsaspora owczarzaki ATCC 30864]|uniref:Uncharacterized protein n=1 Tax=Capsaspora owczarzaki (strain ATCC 30864) TaxID=595528 RepID=A0A0D2WK33_CAPO3|nr:hypothetical protein CAOG_01308 [Capsaspora owczarzaki ATCC 30864]KJE89903.1 hypothetical protein CAOG_001308 [Capsaspora owczarzaki ATCC 30864]|eukprot:XP_004349828.2 hypothetical protein CAOG_01308 [Capsaspora owczarzaki ATCC 30864]
MASRKSTKRTISHDEDEFDLSGSRRTSRRTSDESAGTSTVVQPAALDKIIHAASKTTATAATGRRRPAPADDNDTRDAPAVVDPPHKKAQLFKKPTAPMLELLEPRSHDTSFDSPSVAPQSARRSSFVNGRTPRKMLNAPAPMQVPSGAQPTTSAAGTSGTASTASKVSTPGFDRPLFEPISALPNLAEDIPTSMSSEERFDQLLTESLRYGLRALDDGEANTAQLSRSELQDFAEAHHREWLNDKHTMALQAEARLAPVLKPCAENESLREQIGLFQEGLERLIQEESFWKQAMESPFTMSPLESVPLVLSESDSAHLARRQEVAQLRAQIQQSEEMLALQLCQFNRAVRILQDAQSRNHQLCDEITHDVVQRTFAGIPHVDDARSLIRNVLAPMAV